MAKLTPEQIAGAAYRAGLRDAGKLSTAVAIALGESGGDPAARNAVPPDDSYGLWQINMLGALGPERRRALGLTSNEQLLDPATNARAMMMMSKNGTDWTPWTVYTRGIYLAHLPKGRAAATAAILGRGLGPPLGTPQAPSTGGSGNNPLIPDVIEGPLDTAASTAAAAAGAVRVLAGAGVWMANRNNWMRVVYVGTGGGMLVAALLMAAGPKATRAALSVIPAGKVAGALGKVGKAASKAA